MKVRSIPFALSIALLWGIGLFPCADGRDGVLPDSLSAAIIVKVLAFESSERESETMRIHVLDDEKLTAQLEAFQGSSIRGRKLLGVTFGASVPAGVDVVVASGREALLEAVAYTKLNRAVSVTNNPDLRGLGAALTVYDDEGLPAILLDRAAAKREGLYWEPEILHIARMVGD